MERRSQSCGGLSRKSTLILLVSMFGLGALINLQLLFERVPFSSVESRAGSLVANTVLFFGLFGLSLRYLENENKKIRVEGIVILVISLVMFGVLVATYLALH